MPTIAKKCWQLPSGILLLIAALVTACSDTKSEPGPIPNMSTSSMLISDDAGTSTTQIGDEESGNATKVPATTNTSVAVPSTTVSSTSPVTTTEPKQTTTTQPSVTTTPDVVTEEPGTYSGGFESEEPAKA